MNTNSTVIIDNIEINIIRKNIKNINLTIYPPDGRVRISVPNKIDDSAILSFIQSRLSWINKKRKLLETYQKNIQKFITGETHYYGGSPYTLEVKDKVGKQRVELGTDGKIYLYIKPNNTLETRQKVLREWYRKKLKDCIPQYIEKYEILMNVSVGSWNVKFMKTRWGTCNIQAKRIWINLELAKYDIQCVEYIIVHEMVHLLEKYHNQHFYHLMDLYFPNWKSVRNHMKEHRG